MEESCKKGNAWHDEADRKELNTKNKKNEFISTRCNDTESQFLRKLCDGKEN